MDDQYYRKARSKSLVLQWSKRQLKKRWFLLALLIVVPAFSFLTFSNRGVLKHLSLESDKRVVEEKIREAQKEQAQLQALSKALDNDPKAIEKVAREKFGMIKPGETVYKVKKN